MLDKLVVEHTIPQNKCNQAQGTIAPNWIENSAVNTICTSNAGTCDQPGPSQPSIHPLQLHISTLIQSGQDSHHTPVYNGLVPTELAHTLHSNLLIIHCDTGYMGQLYNSGWAHALWPRVEIKYCWIHTRTLMNSWQTMGPVISSRTHTTARDPAKGTLWTTSFYACLIFNELWQCTPGRWWWWWSRMMLAWTAVANMKHALNCYDKNDGQVDRTTWQSN